MALLATDRWGKRDILIYLPSLPSPSYLRHLPNYILDTYRFLLFIVSVLEFANGAAIYDQARGSGRKPGEFNFDPLGFAKDPKKRARYATSEIKNGRLAMLAFSGIVTQAVTFPDKSFPYLF